MIACMGGFCSSRDRCQLYHAELRENPTERLCGQTERPIELGSEKALTRWSVAIGQLVNTSSTGQQDMACSMETK